MSSTINPNEPEEGTLPSSSEMRAQFQAAINDINALYAIAGVGTEDANTVLAGPATGSAATTSFRALVAADIPATLGATSFTGTAAATAFNVGGNSVLVKAVQGTISVYGTLTFGSGTTLNAGGTITAAGGTLTSLTAAGLLAGGVITTAGTVSLTAGTGIGGSGGTITNAGVIQVGTLTGTIGLGAGLSQSGGSLSATGSMSGVTAGAGLTTALGSSGGTITTAGTLSVVSPPNAQTGTTYAIADSDHAKTVTFSNGSAVAVTIAQAGAASAFLSGWWAIFENIGTGLVTITPTTSTIGGATTWRLPTGWSVRIESNGTNYLASSFPAFYGGTGGSIANWLPGIPSSTLGGNARGSQSIDFQAIRNSATQVASGVACVAYGNYVTASGVGSLGVGFLATSTGADSTAVGSNISATANAASAFGFNMQATVQNATAVGSTSTASGVNSIALGYFLTVGAGSNSAGVGSTSLITGSNSFGMGFKIDDRGNSGGYIRGSWAIDTTGVLWGRSQLEEYWLLNTTSGSSAVRLTSTEAAAGAATVANIGTQQSCSVTIEIIIRNTVSGVSATFSLAQSLIEKGASNATTVFTPNAGGVIAGPASGSPFTLAANPTVVADTTNGGLNISYTPPVANTDKFYAEAYVRYIMLRSN